MPDTNSTIHDDADLLDGYEQAQIPDELPREDLSSAESYDLDAESAEDSPLGPPEQWEQRLDRIFGRESDGETEVAESDASEDEEEANEEGEPPASADTQGDAGGNAQDQWHPQLLAWAAALGIPADEAKSDFASPQALYKHLLRMSQGHPGAAAQRQADEATPASETSTQGEADDLDEEVYPPEIVRAIRKLRDDNRELRTLLEQQIVAPRQREFHDWFDEQCDKSGVATLGKGSLTKQTLQKPHFEARKELFTLMAQLQQVFPNESREQLFERAVAARYPQEVKAKTEKALGKKLKERAGMAVGRSRPSAPPISEEKRSERQALRELRREYNRMVRENGD